MFSKTFISLVSRLLLCSFLYLNFYSTAVAMQEMDIFVRPYKQYFQENDFSVPIRQLFACQHLKHEPKQQQKAIENFIQLMEVSWTVQVVKHVSNQITNIVEHVFTPYLALQELLKKSAEEIQNHISKPLKLADFCEEKRILDLEEGWQAEVAWDGRLKISQKAKNTPNLSVQSLTEVILDNVQASDLSISAPSVSLTGIASIDHLSLNFEGDFVEGVESSHVFELSKMAQLTTRNLDMNGLLFNKGLIDLKDPASLKASSIINLGTLKTAGYLNIELQSLLRNSGCIVGENLSLSANIIQQVFLSNSKPLLKAKTLKEYVSEGLNFAAGILEADHVEITNLGTFENKAEIKTKELHLSIQKNFVNDGMLQADSFDLKSYSSFLNQGVLQVRQGARISMAPQTIFDQNGVLQATKLIIDGNQSLFKNTNRLVASEVHLYHDIQFENKTPLSAAELSGTQKAEIQTVFDRVILHDSTGKWINTGFLRIQQGSLPFLENQGIFVSEKLSVTNLQQKGKIKVSQMTLLKEGLNTGTMLVSRLSGTGNFQQSGQFTADQNLDVSLSHFEQKKVTAKEPRLEVKKATFSGSILKNGKNCHWMVEDQTITGSSYPFENEGELKSTHLHVARSVRNNGSISCQTFKGSGEFENNDKFLIAQETYVDFTEFKQKGTFQANNLTGHIQKWENSNNSSVISKNSLTIDQSIIQVGSSLEIIGFVKGNSCINNGSLILKGGVLQLVQAFTGSLKSRLILQEGPLVISFPAGKVILSLNNRKAGLIASEIQNQGEIFSKQDLLVASENSSCLGSLCITGNVLYEGSAATDSLRNTNFAASRISGNVSVQAPLSSLKITTPLNLSNPLQIHVRNITQKADIKAKTLDIKAQKVESEKPLVSQGELKIEADYITSSELVTSTENSVLMKGLNQKKVRQFYNQGTIITTKAPLIIYAENLANFKDLASNHSLKLQTTKTTFYAGSRVSAPVIEHAVQTLQNEGLIQAERSLIFKAAEDLQNAGQIQAENLTLSTEILRNSGTIQGNSRSHFEVRKTLDETESSTLVLDHAHITLPSSYLSLNGTFQVTTPQSWNVYSYYTSTPVTEHRFFIGSHAKLILRDYDFKWSDFKNYGIFELHNGEAIGSGTYYASSNSVTSYSGNFKLETKKLDEYGLTRSQYGIHLTCRSGGSHWGRYEANGDIEFEISDGVSDENASQTLMNINLEQSKISQGHRFHLEAPTINFNLTKDIKFGGEIDMNLRSLSNSGTLWAYDLNIRAAQHLYNTGLIYSGGRIDISAYTLRNSERGQIAAKQAVQIVTKSDLLNTSPLCSGNYTQRGYARIFSEKDRVFLQSYYGNIQNTFATLQAKTYFDLKAACTIDNRGGLMCIEDQNATSRFSAPNFIDSCVWEKDTETRYRSERECYYRTEHYDGVNLGTFLTLGIYRPTRSRQVSDYRMVQKPYTVYEIHERSVPGEIFIGGNCILDIQNYQIEGGALVVGNRIYNTNYELLNLQARQIGNYSGLVQANSLDLVLANLRSQGGQFRIGGGALCLRSQGVITFISGEKNHRIQLQTFVSPGHYACRYASLFEMRADGTLHLRAPETETGRWNVTQAVLTKKIELGKPVQFMISPEAFLRSLSFIPTQEVGLWSKSSTDLFLMLHQNAERTAKNHVISKEKALCSTVSMLIWNVQERNGIQELYPVLVFPQTLIRITDDVYSEGNVYLSSQRALTLDQATVHARGNLSLKSEDSITQKGGQLVSESSLVIEAPQIYHTICQETLSTLEKQSNVSTLRKREQVTDIPIMQASVIQEKGHVTATAVHIQANTYEHSGGTLEVKPAILTETTHSLSHKGQQSSEMQTSHQTAIPSRIQAQAAHFHGDTILTGTVARLENIYKYAGLTLSAQVLTDSYTGTSTKSGFFRNSTIRTTGTHQQALPTLLDGKVLKDMNDRGGPFIMRSSILKVLDQEITTNLIQETEFLKHEDVTETKTSGWNLPWFDDPRPALWHSLNALVEASTTADRAVAGLQSVTNSLRLISNAIHLSLEKAPYIPTLLYGIANKVATLSYGTTTTKEWVQKEIPVPNKIEAHVLRIKNKKTHLEGPVQTQTLEIEAEELTAQAPQEKIHHQTESRSTSISFNPLQVLTSGPLGLLPGISHTKSTHQTEELTPTTLPIIADTIVLKVGNLAFTGAQLSARIVNAIVDGTMTVESLQNEVISTTKQSAWNASLGTLGSVFKSSVALVGGAHHVSPLPMIPTFRSEDRSHVEKFVQHMARFVGEEAFALKVGQALIKRSAEVGLRVDGMVTNSGLDASKVINQPLQDVHIDKHEAFAVPLSDAIALFGAVNELTLLRRQAFEAMKSQGVSDREAMEVLNKPEVKKQIITMAERKEKLQQEALKIQEKFEQAKVEAAQPLYDTEDILADDDPRSLAYQIVLNQEQEAKENFARKAEAEYRQELREIDTLSKASWGRATPEFLRVTARQKLLDATVSWGCQYIPFYQHFHNLLESEFMEALKGGTVEAALWMIPVGKVAEFLTKPIAKPVMKILEKQAKRYGAKVVDKLPNLFKNPDVMKRGLEYENYVAESVPGRLKPNHPTFDFFNRETRHATSVKSIDTQTAAKLANPKQIYQVMKKNIDKTVNYNGEGVVQVRPEEILSRELRVGIPIETNPSQWQQIQRAVEYGKSKDVNVIIETLK